MVIRPIQPADFTYFEIPPFASTASAWVLETTIPIGYAAIDPVPGLPHIYDLYGFIDPVHRRCGYGSALLRFIVHEAQQMPQLIQLSAPVDSTYADAIPFLQKHGFYNEHLEYELSRPLQDAFRPTGFRLKRLPQHLAARKMNQLYDLCFQDLAWYQPYIDDAEVIANLGADGQIYFLESVGGIVGFAGVRYEGRKAEIEPLGIVPAHRGEGFGRILLHTLLHTFYERGCQFVHLTVWADNTPALRLYESEGFRRQDHRQFMALDI